MGNLKYIDENDEDILTKVSQVRNTPFEPLWRG